MQQSAEVYIFAEIGMKREWEMFEGDLAETSNSAKSLLSSNQFQGWDEEGMGDG